MSRGRGKNAPDRSAELEVQAARTMPAIIGATIGDALPEQARELLDMICGSDTAMRVVKPEDLPLLEQYCMAWQVYQDAKRSYVEKGEGERLREDTGTAYKRNEDIGIMFTAMDQMLKLAKQMGLTPVARTQMRMQDAATASLMATSFPERIAKMFEAGNGR